MPSPDQIAHVIVAAARAMNVDPIEVASYQGSGHRRDAQEWVRVTRARYYAARALVEVYPVSKGAAARLVGVKRDAASAYLNGYESRPIQWFDEAILKRVVDAAPRDVSISAPSKAVEKNDIETIPSFLPPKTDTPPSPVRRRDLIDPRKVAPVEPTSRRDVTPRTGLNRFSERFGAREFDAGGSQQLDRRASERRNLRDILAEAARNTAAMQKRQENDGGKTEEADD